MSTKIKVGMKSALLHEAWKMPHKPTEHDHQPVPYHSKQNTRINNDHAHDT
jgi:hypothetical protein